MTELALTILPETPADADVIERLHERHSLLERVYRMTAALEASDVTENLGYFQRKALTLLTSRNARAALDLSSEPEAVKARYGPTLFGTSLLAARRLVEAGVTFVAVTTESRGGGHWDSHNNNFGMLKAFNLPNLDQITTALL